MTSREILLTRLQQVELQLSELKRDFNEHFPHGEGTDVPEVLYKARSFPGGAIQSFEHDVARLKLRVNEYLPRE